MSCKTQLLTKKMSSYSIKRIEECLTVLNKKYKKLHPAERFKELYKDFPVNQILVTSSFGITSSIILNLVHQTNPTQQIYFIDTSYHFKETLAYKKQLSNFLQLEVIDISAGREKNQYTRHNRMWAENPDLCCQINKVNPLSEIKKDYTVWVSGLMKDQTDHRKNLNIFEYKNNIIKFHPIIDMNEAEAGLYMSLYELPIHPLTNEGYGSIGCTHCTQKGDCRTGRWVEATKTECGLHL